MASPMVGHWSRFWQDIDIDKTRSDRYGLNSLTHLIGNYDWDFDVPETRRTSDDLFVIPMNKLKPKGPFERLTMDMELKYYFACRSHFHCVPPTLRYRLVIAKINVSSIFDMEDNVLKFGVSLLL
jgi:hypothetical protein